MALRRRDRGPTLRVTGLVARETEWAWEELDRLPGGIADLGSVAEGFVGRAVPLGPLIERSAPLPEAEHVSVESDDGLYRASIPRRELESKGWLAYDLEGRPLPRERGGPLRVVVPQGRTLCWNVKGVVELRLTAEQEPDSVPENPPH